MHEESAPLSLRHGPLPAEKVELPKADACPTAPLTIPLRASLSFCAPQGEAAQPTIELELSKADSYDDVSRALAARLGLDHPLKLRLTGEPSRRRLKAFGGAGWSLGLGLGLDHPPKLRLMGQWGDGDTP